MKYFFIDINEFKRFLMELKKVWFFYLSCGLKFGEGLMCMICFLVNIYEVIIL